MNCVAWPAPRLAASSRREPRADELNADLLEFIQAGAQRVSARTEGAPLTH